MFNDVNEAENEWQFFFCFELVWDWLTTTKI